MKIAKIKPVKTPSRGTSLSAGIDFYVPDDFNEVYLRKHESILIQSGIKVKLPTDTVLVAFNKSGVAVNKGLQVGACVIDEDYQGEIGIHLTKITGGITQIKARDKVAQFLLLPIIYENIYVVEEKNLYSEVSERGTGGYGSTDKK